MGVDGDIKKKPGLNCLGARSAIMPFLLEEISFSENKSILSFALFASLRKKGLNNVFCYALG